jgi:hypothetical protein
VDFNVVRLLFGFISLLIALEFWSSVQLGYALNQPDLTDAQKTVALADEVVASFKRESSDLDRLGMLQARMSRASRLVVDTGLHAFGWSRQRAIDFIMALHIGSVDGWRAGD